MKAGHIEHLETRLRILGDDEQYWRSKYIAENSAETREHFYQQMKRKQDLIYELEWALRIARGE
jgi:hypothetical protein